MGTSPASLEGTDSSRPADPDWALVVAWFLALNLLDLGLTLHLVNRGAVEVNPLMAAMLARGWEWAAGFKLVLSAGVGAGLWFGRDHHLVRRAGHWFVILLAAILVYQVINLWTAN